MNVERSFLSFSPKVRSKTNKENIPFRKRPKFSTKRLCHTGGGAHPLSEKWMSPSSLKNMKSNVNESSKEEEKILKSLAFTEQLQSERGKKNLSLSRSDTQSQENIICLNDHSASKGEICGIVIRQQQHPKNKISQDDSVVVISETDSEQRSPIFGYTPNSNKKFSKKLLEETVVVQSSESEEEILQSDASSNVKITSNDRKSCNEILKITSNDRKSCNEIPASISSGNRFLSKSRYNNVKSWLEGAGSRESVSPKDKVQEESASKTDDSISVSSVNRILNENYGSHWKNQDVLVKGGVQLSDEVRRRTVTDVCCNRKNVLRERVPSADSDDNFNEFIQNVRKKFESTRSKLSGTTEESSFINDDVENNSLGFYQSTANKLTAEKTKSEACPVAKILPPKRLFGSADDSDNPEQKGASNQKVMVPKKSKKTIKKVTLKHVSPIHRSSPPKVLSFLRSLSGSPPAARCHPRALAYKQNFKKLKDKLVKELFALYNDVVFDNHFPSDMRVEWNARMKSTAGFCYNRRVMSPTKGKIRSSRIELSTKVCGTADRVRDTLIHELCHAATWVIDDVKGGHGPHWKAWASKARKRLPDLPPIKRCHEYVVETKYTYKCTKCGYSFGRHSKSLNLAVKRCGYCLGTFELLVNTKSKNTGAVATSTPRTPRNATGFALYVKENYRSVKSTRSDWKHGDIMKLLGQQFSQVKIGSAP